MKSVFNIGLALKNVRSRFFHTFLSILGMVIGVAALVGTLSLIDGMEKFAKEQIASNTSLQTIQIRSKQFKEVNGVRVLRDTQYVLDYEAFEQLISRSDNWTRAMLRSFVPGNIQLYQDSDTIQSAAYLTGVARWGEPFSEEEEQDLIGRTLSEADIKARERVCVLNQRMAESLKGDQEPAALLGQHIQTPYGKLEVVGIETQKDDRNQPVLLFPFTLYNPEDLEKRLPFGAVEVVDVTMVNQVKDSLISWLDAQFPNGKASFQVQTNAFWVSQAEKGFLLFRVIMGMIVGLSVLVGGIGIMNVMLITVRDRTSEIGICKAMGARRRDIFLQFLSESITISSLGSFLGLVLGLLATLAAVPIIKSVVDVPFQAAYTLNTLLVIVVIAILVGVLFGTYPALTASRLDPVDAMRRE